MIRSFADNGTKYLFTTGKSRRLPPRIFGIFGDRPRFPRPNKTGKACNQEIKGRIKGTGVELFWCKVGLTENEIDSGAFSFHHETAILYHLTP
jgi:hypothetical protein